jgi:hypothetical protein
MKRKRHTPEDIIKKLRAAEEALAGGKTVEEACQNPPGCSQALSASDEFRSHSRLPEPVNNPRNPRLEPGVAIDISVCGNKTPNKPSIPKTNKKTLIRSGSTLGGTSDLSHDCASGGSAVCV